MDKQLNKNPRNKNMNNWKLCINDGCEKLISKNKKYDKCYDCN